jgi:oxygen-dependent protoporphyrinogen oxidase
MNLTQVARSGEDRPARALRVAVIGGGVSGLAAAHRLIELSARAPQAVDVTLFEASGRVGGLFGTREIGDYRVETGADSFITNKPWAVDLCRRLGLDGRLIGTSAAYRKSFILCRGRPVETPIGFELMVPRNLRAVLASPLLSVRGKLAMAAEAFVPPRRDASDESLASFARRRFGQEVLERLIQPLISGIYTADPEKLSMEATLPRFRQMEREHGSLLKAVWRERQRSRERRRSNGAPGTETNAQDSGPASGARYGLFATPRRGMSELLDALKVRVSTGGHLRLQTRVTRIQPGDPGYTLTTQSTNATSGEAGEAAAGEAPLTPPPTERGPARESFDGVIVAVPAYRAAELVRTWAAELAGQLEAIEYASSAIVVTGHRLADVAHPLDGSGLVVPSVENRPVLAVSFLSRKFPDRAPEDRVILRSFVGGAMRPELLARTDEDLITLVRDELSRLLGVRGNPEFALVARYERAMPQYHVGHLERVAALQARWSALPGFELAGNAYHGVGVPDSIHSGEEAAERLLAGLLSGRGVPRDHE